MKKYKVTVTQDKKVVYEDEILASTEKKVKIDTQRKYPFGKIKIIRMKKKPGIQMTIDDFLESEDC